MIRFLLGAAGLIVGLVVALMLLIAVELFSAVVHPFPEGFGGSEEEICAHVERYPAWVLATVVPMWALVAFCGVLVARKIGGLVSSLLVGALLLAAVGFNQWMLPYPKWFEVANFAALPLAMWGAVWIGQTKGKVVPSDLGDQENPSY